MTTESMPPLPEWAPHLELSDSPLERFIYSNEPAGLEDAEEFRADLLAALHAYAQAYAAQEVAKEREACAKLRVALEDACREWAGLANLPINNDPQWFDACRGDIERLDVWRFALGLPPYMQTIRSRP